MKRMYKKAAVFALALCMFSSNVSYAYVKSVDMVPFDDDEASELNTEELYKNAGLDCAYDLLEHLNIVTEDKNSIDISQAATKALAATYFSRIKTCDTIIVDLPYSDVSENTPNYMGICAAYESGIIKEAQKFSPSTQINLNDAALMAMRTVSYDVLFSENEAMKFAYENDIFSGVDTTKNYITVGELMRMVENTLSVPYIDYKVNSSQDYSVSVKKDVSYIEKYKNITIQQGIVTAYSYSSIYADSYITDGEIEINRGRFVCYADVSSDIVGKSVKAYVDMSDDIKAVVSVWEYRNTSNELSFDETEEVSNSYITSINEKKSRRMRTSYDTKVLYNDVCYGTLEKALNDNKFDKFEKICAIDNNSDSIIDVIKIYDCDTYIVRSVSTVSERIDLMYGYDTIFVSDNDNEVYITKNGEKKEFTDLAKWNVLSVYYAVKPDGIKIYNIKVSDKKLTDTFSGKYTDEYGRVCYIIAGTGYKLTDNFVKFLETDKTQTKPIMGSEFTFLLTYDGKIAGVASQASGFMFGWIMNTVHDDDDDEMCAVKMFTYEGDIEKYWLCEKVKLFNSENPEGKRVTAKEAYNYFTSGEQKYYEMIGYRINAEDKITEIAAAIDCTASNKKIDEYPLTKDFTNLKGYDTNGRPEYNSVRVYTNILDAKYYVNGKKALAYPVDIANRNDDKSYQLQSVSYTDKYFNDSTVSLYNVNEYFEPEIVSLGMNVAMTIDTEASAYMIAKVETGIDADDQPVKTISYYSGSALLTKNLSNDCKILDEAFKWYGQPDSPDKLVTGDIIQMTTDIAGDINLIRVLYKRDNPSPVGYQDPRSAQNSSITMSSVSSIKVICGKVTDYNERTVLVDISSDSAKSDVWPVFSGWGGYGKVTFAMYDSKKKKVFVIDRNELQIGDRVVVRKYYNYGVDFFIIR